MITEDRLCDVLGDFARTLVTDYPIEGILDHLVQRIVDILPIGAAGVSLISPGTHPRFIAGSDRSATRYEHLQTALMEGPCLAAFELDTPISVPDLAEDDRFPRFSEQAQDIGLAAVFAFPLRHGERRLGALDLYRTTTGALDERDMAAAQTLADVATAYVVNAQAREAKSEFVATVSHELRTPMASISGYLELLEDLTAGPLNSEQAVFVAAIRRNSNRLAGLADDLLDLSSLEAGTFQHEPRLVDFGAAISTSLAALEPMIAGKELDVTLVLPTGAVIVLGDLASLEVLATNLLSNAVKYTESGGWVRCTLQVEDGLVRLDVSDNGLGIPEEEQSLLFSRFFRATTAQDYAIQGSGLGLTIVDSIVQSHGGEISVVSGHLAGSTFTVTLPLPAAS